MRFTVLACRYDSFYTYFNFQFASDLAADACSAPGAARERPDCPPAQTGATLSAPVPVAAHEPGRRAGLRDAVREAGKARGKELVPPEGFTVPCALIDDEASRRRPRHQADGYTIAAIETKACRNDSSQRRSRSGTPRCRPTANGEISRATSAILPRTTVFDGGSGLSTLPASGPELAGLRRSSVDRALIFRQRNGTHDCAATRDGRASRASSCTVRRRSAPVECPWTRAPSTGRPGMRRSRPMAGLAPAHAER